MVLTLTDSHGELSQGGIEGGGFTRARGPSDQHNTVGAFGHGLPALKVFSHQPQLSKICAADTSGSKIRITSFSPKAVGMVDRRSSTSLALGATGFNAAILGATFLGHIHTPEYF